MCQFSPPSHPIPHPHPPIPYHTHPFHSVITWWMIGNIRTWTCWVCVHLLRYRTFHLSSYIRFHRSARNQMVIDRSQVQGLLYRSITIIFLGFELKLDHPSFLIEEAFTEAIGLAQRVPSWIAKLIDFIVSSRARVDIGCMGGYVRSLRNLCEERGLNLVILVLRCLVVK